ncbi:glycoside hydrolase family 5 protein [Pseudomonas oryzihabitans]|uniref:glycoside hydrolase family 5 protein n=1 Tax=Pseudomonas oryzihabitans TaxID=47885 RepID=UPI00286C2C78|nr:glycoside hydrolase family 5 protein [Pseudomonas psychrotolerans]
MTSQCLSRWLASFCVICSLSANATALPAGLVGLNLSGAGFAGQVVPGVNGTNYIFPVEAYFKQWSQKGVRFIRFPILWERLQPKLFGEFDETYAKLIDITFSYAAKHDVKIILDLHNYARYRGSVIGTGAVPYSSYQDVITKIARRWSSQSALYAYDIMNEPHDTTAYWPTAAQYGINGIRSVDTTRPIMIEGNGWAEATRWPQWNDSLLNLKDPANSLIFEAHTYFDENAGGSYSNTDVSRLSANYGVERVRPFVEWLKKNGKQGYIGEFGVPDDDPRWLVIMDNMLSYLRQYCIPSTYWAAGPGWGDYKLSVEPINGVDRPQWGVLKKYLEPGGCRRVGPFNGSSSVSIPVDNVGEVSPGVSPDNKQSSVAASSSDLTQANSTGADSTSRNFDALAYTASYPDLINTFGIDENAAATHYQKSGAVEGRVVIFSASQYLANYADLRAAFGSDLEAAKRHYILYGYKEGRTWLPLSGGTTATAVFSGSSSGYNIFYNAGVVTVVDIDPTNGNDGVRVLSGIKLIVFSDRNLSLTTLNGLAYIASYDDLMKSLGADAEAGVKHYVEYGFKEGRKSGFNGLSYIASYMDLIKAFGANADAGSRHYIQNGYREGRKVTFDPAEYLSRHSDLQGTFGSDLEAATNYYIINGYRN